MSKTTRDRKDRDRIDYVLERRRSGAAGTHADRRTRRLRTRSAVRRNLVLEGTR